MAILANSKKPLSAIEMQGTLGHTYYEPVWAMLHKLRVTTGHRDAQFKLKDFVEANDAQFEISKTKKETRNNKPGAGSKGKAKVAVQTLLAKDLRRKGKVAKGTFKFVKMTAIENLKTETLTKAIKDAVHPETTHKTDGGTGFISAQLQVATHIKRVMQGTESIKHLP